LFKREFSCCKRKELKGVKVCHQAYAKYEEDFDERADPTGKNIGLPASL